MNARLLGPGNRSNGVVVANLAKQANLTVQQIETKEVYSRNNRAHASGECVVHVDRGAQCDSNHVCAGPIKDIQIKIILCVMWCNVGGDASSNYFDTLAGLVRPEP